MKNNQVQEQGIFMVNLLAWHHSDILYKRFCVRGIVGKAKEAIRKYGLEWVDAQQKKAKDISINRMVFWNAIMERMIEEYNISNFGKFIREYERYLKKGCHGKLVQYRAVLHDYPQGEPGGGGIESTLGYGELPKTEWIFDLQRAKRQGEYLKRQFAGTDFSDFYVHLEGKQVELFKINSALQEIEQNTPDVLNKCCHKYAVPGQPGWFIKQFCPECRKQFDALMSW